MKINCYSCGRSKANHLMHTPPSTHSSTHVSGEEWTYCIMPVIQCTARHLTWRLAETMLERYSCSSASNGECDEQKWWL